ncbi:MAG: DNA repair protein RadA [Kiloniellales bacterium]|nr:DNA repair protein RadA [Kiloniellales bacterium]
MAKRSPRYVCQSCGASYPKWSGRCEACGSWNSIIEEQPREAPPGGLAGGSQGRPVAFARLDGAPAENGERGPRWRTGIAEFDRVCGGGLIPGSALLIGGDPGIGKSTVLLQALAALSRGAAGPALPCAYISGEESVDQVRLRAGRLGLEATGAAIAAATSVRDILASLDREDPPAVVVIDSIQTMYLDSLDSAPGTVAQVRGSAQELIRLAKRRGFAVLLVGHVTKEGLIAGPKVLEHMVDTVLTFEGERGHQFRILRAAKNRFGPTDEIGVFEMTDGGLVEVANPSSLFLSERHGEVSGAAVFAGIEGTRPILVEIQALVSASPLATPRRAVVGWDSGRLAMVLAVLEARCGLAFAGRDVYLNVAGGLRITEPAADLAVAAALVSAASGRAVPGQAVVFGEIALSGEVRPVSQMELRVKEAAKLGFTEVIGPERRRTRGAETSGQDGWHGLAAREIGHLAHLVALLAEDSAPVRHSFGGR